MILVQDTFICKPGNASKLAKIFREWAGVRPPKRKTQILTDMTGQFHRVIATATYENLAEYEEEIKNMEQNQTPEEKALMEKFKDMNEMYVSGGREIYKVW